MDKIDKEKFDPALEPCIDKIHRIARASAATVPVVGGALAEGFNAIFSPPYEIRTNAWLHQLSDTLNLLIKNHNQTASQLKENGVLLSAIIRSSDIAVRTSSPDVTKALSNGLISVALNQKLEEAIIAIYLNSISRLTSLHLKLLAYLSHLPELDLKIQINEEQQLQFFRDVSAHSHDFSIRHIVHRLMQDLINENIIGVPDGASQSMRGPNFINMRLTSLGEEFVGYISETEI